MNEELYQILKRVAAEGQVTYYSVIAPIVGLDMSHPEDRNQISVLLDAISTHEHRNGHPLLSAVVIHRQDNMPGNGFFKMAQHVRVYNGGDRYIFFIEELRRVHDYWRRHQIV